MAIAKRYSIYPAVLQLVGDPTATTLNIRQLQSFNFEQGSAKSRIVPGGALDPQATIISSGDPMVRFGSRDLATVLAAISPNTGIALDGATGGGKFYLQQRDCGGTFRTDAVHELYTVTEGHIIPVDLSANQDDAEGAVCNFTIYALYDGTNNPVIHATDIDLSGVVTPLFNSYYYMGPVFLGASEIEGVVSVRVDFGLQVSTRRWSGQFWPECSVITTRVPIINFDILNAKATAALDMFSRCTADDLVFYFWKGQPCGTRVARATAEHISVTAASGSEWSDDTVSVIENDDATISLIVNPHGPLTVNTATAIPA